jgi:hypothetical protein
VSVPEVIGGVLKQIVRVLQATPLPLQVYELLLKVVRNVVSSNDPVAAASRAVIATSSKHASNKVIDETLKLKSKLTGK